MCICSCYTDVAQDVWLTDAECEELRHSVLAIFPPVELSSDSFLDRRSVAEAEALPEPLDIPTETLIDEGLGRSAAYDIVFANILDPLSLRRDDRPVLRHEMPAQSHKHIFGGTLKLLSALAKESTLSADPNYCEELADQLEQLLPIIASLRREAQTALNSSNTSAGPVPTILNERRDSVPPSSETTSNTSSSIIRPSTQGCESCSSSDEISTQTGSQFTFDIMDSTKPDDKHQDLLSGEVPNVHFEICPSGNPSMLEIEDKGADQVVALAYDDPTFNHGGTSVPDFEEFLRNLDQDTEPAKRGYNAWG